MNSPFPYETYAQESKFYGRKDEISKILEYASVSNNLVIYSKRRMGKSSLVKEAFRRKEKEYIFLYCDIYDIASKEDFGATLLKSLANSLKGDIKSVVKQLGSILKRTRLEYIADPNTGKMSIKPVVSALSLSDMLEDFFSTLFELSKKQKVVVAIDEFQQISTIKDAKLDAALRKYIQENYNISYIFLGSKRHMLSKLFEYGLPLFEEATPLSLGSLEQDEVQSYVSKHLNISKEMIAYIYNLSDGETKLMQHIFHVLYMAHRRKKIGKDIIDEAVSEIIKAKSSGYRVVFDSFSPHQKKAFKILSKYGKNLLSKEMLSENNISKASMQSALKQLYARELIDKENDIWFVPDRAFELWGKTLY